MMLRIAFIVFLFIGQAFASPSLEMRVAEQLRAYAAIGDDARIDITRMTKVRGAVDSVEIRRFDLDRGYFEAVIASSSQSALIKGRAQVKVPVVVPRNTVPRDTEIAAEDIKVAYAPLSHLPRGAYQAVADVAGQSARHSLASGRPICADDVGYPIIVKKNQAIEILYEKPGMFLSMRGRALTNGSAGETIRVVSEGQGMIVDAEIISASQVAVR